MSFNRVAAVQQAALPNGYRTLLAVTVCLWLAMPTFGQTINFCSIEDGLIYAQDSDIQFLGRITADQFASDSIMNVAGQYGSSFSSQSIFNEFGPYGSPFSSYSAFNEFANQPPRIIKNRQFVAFLTVNKFRIPSVDPVALVEFLNLGSTCHIPPSPSPTRATATATVAPTGTATASPTRSPSKSTTSTPERSPTLTLRPSRTSTPTSPAQLTRTHSATRAVPSETPTGTAAPASTSSFRPTPTAGPCAANCNGDSRVDVSELVTAVNIALGAMSLSSCSQADLDLDGSVSVDELIRAVTAALFGCLDPSPRATLTWTNSPISSATAPVAPTRSELPSASPSNTASATRLPSTSTPSPILDPPTPTASGTRTCSSERTPELVGDAMLSSEVTPSDTEYQEVLHVTVEASDACSEYIVRAALRISANNGQTGTTEMVWVRTSAVGMPPGVGTRFSVPSNLNQSIVAELETVYPSLDSGPHTFAVSIQKTSSNYVVVLRGSSLEVLRQ